ncbi:MAG: phosphate ABC transporter permease PstA, partial [Acholeplasmataceae bacterium]|nr:phosphate ABC transporter permease PstA [Acholeplasmataceae bacterium]
MSNKRKTKDNIAKSITYMASFFSLAILILIVIYVFSNGFKLLNWDLITNNYESVNFIAELHEGEGPIYADETRTFGDDVFYSSKWGIALKDDTNLLGKNVVEVYHIDESSPFLDLYNKGISTQNLELKKEYSIIRIAFDEHPSALSRYGAEHMIDELDMNDSFRELEFTTSGGGIRGSIITTLYLIIFTLVFALPIGVGAAIYLNEYAPENKFTQGIRSLIETLTGVPSIIYGLMGLAVFVPLTIRLTNATGGNIISGAMTLAVILLPIIIRTTEESLKVVPDDYRQASLALGASKTQTTFKIILPSAFSGILTATLLAIGRIIGESAALVFAIGTTIKDDVYLTEKSTSLSVHIWSMMTDEPANIALSTTIAIIILAIVLILNITIKFLSGNMLRKLGVH